MITIKDLNKFYGSHHVLTDINLNIDKPGIYAVLGPNGSGKSTLIKNILGLVLPKSGDILVNNKSIKDNCKYRNNISYLPQIARFPENLKVKELIKMVSNIRKQSSNHEELIDLFNIRKELNKKTGNLSGGNKQKVNMVLAFMFDNPIIILDEPTTGLDPVAITKFKALVKRKKEEGKIIIFTTHIMSLVEEISDEIIFILDGKIHYRGNMENIIEPEQESTLEKAIANIIEYN